MLQTIAEKENGNRNGGAFFDEIRTIVDAARGYAYSAVNTAMVQAYWLIGKRIVEEEQHGKKRAEYGENLIKSLSKFLTDEFGKGFSHVNLKSFRLFYLTFANGNGIHHTLCDELLNSGDNQKGHAARALSGKSSAVRSLFETAESIPFLGRLTWTHYRQIMRVTDPKARAWYLKEAAESHWSSRTLDRNIATQYYERLLISQVREPVVTEMQEKTAGFQADKLEFIKNPAVLEFLGLQPNLGYTEAALETAITDNLQRFLLELGKGYAFVERQKLIRTEVRNYYVDLPSDEELRAEIERQKTILRLQLQDNTHE